MYLKLSWPLNFFEREGDKDTKRTQIKSWENSPIGQIPSIIQKKQMKVNLISS